jgi:hypothetical protein
MNQFLKRAAALAAVATFTGAVLFTGGADAQTGDARIRVLHASPDAPAVDVYVDGAEAVSNLAFPNITDYVSLPAGDYAVKVFPASANGTGTPVIDVPALSLSSGKDYTVAAVGTLSAIEPFVLEDNNAAPAAGKAHVRVVHASPDAPNVDIFAQGAGVVVSNLPFKQGSAYLPLDAGSYNLEVRAAGGSAAVLSLPNTALEAGKVYTAFAVGLAAGDPALSVRLTTDATAQQPTATPQSQPTAAPTTSPAAVPAGGGTPGDDGISPAVWVLLAVAGLAVMASAGAVVLARQRISN